MTDPRLARIQAAARMPLPRLAADALTTALQLIAALQAKDAALRAAAVNAAPHLLAELGALRAQLEALVGLVERWPELDCASWCSDLRCTCGAEDQNLVRAAARLARGLEER